jgi:hypothetical protein
MSIVLCLLASAPPAAQAESLPRAVLPKAAVTVDPAQHDVGRLVVKLAEGAPGLAAAGSIADPAVRAAIGTRTVRPFFAGLERELAVVRARVLAALPPGQRPPADLSLYFEVTTAGAADARALLAALNVLPQVELAYPRELPVPPPGDIPPLTPSFVVRQGYRDAAPNGIDAHAIQQLTGAWGEGLTVLDIEWGWWFDHEDLGVLRPGSLVGPPVFNNSYNDHGLAVVGEIAADADQYGVTGLTPDIDLLVATDYPSTGYSVARAIVTGLPHLRAGDVMLLEAQTSTPRGLGPTEWNQADFDAIQNATRLGVITVEAAGNGNANLDDPAFNGLFDLTVRDSGALIVGATTGAPLTRASFSTYGSRVDANGWGGSVASTGYGNMFFPGNDRRQSYTATFGGTSSASPIVTSAVVALLGAARAQLEPARAAAMDYRALRTLLRTQGTPTNPPAQGISQRPDLARAFRAAGLERGLRLLDPARIGQTLRIEVTPGFAATPSDLWVLLGAQAPANLALPAPFQPPHCDRLLLDPATMLVLAQGAFAGANHVVPAPLPNLPDPRGLRTYLQAVTLQAGPVALCTTNSVMVFVEP